MTLLSSAIGGWLGGYLADRIGRVKTLQFTILWFSFFSLVCAFVQNFDQLLIARRQSVISRFDFAEDFPVRSHVI